MKFSRKHMYAAALPLTVGGLLATSAAALPASAAVRHPAPPRHVATGSMALAGPLQYEQFRALQGFGRHHGVVEYTNWTYAEPGTGVYAPQSGSHQLEFTYGTGKYDHTLNAGLKLRALSNDRLAFSGTGFYNGGGVTWTIRGQVHRGLLRATIAYDGQTYKVFLIGTIAADGSVSGTAKAVNPAQDLTFTMPAGTFASVLHYIAPIKADQIRGRDVAFQFVIPKTAPDLAGITVFVRAHDGGWGPRHDRYAEGTGIPLQPYPIIGGPGVTVR